LGEFLGYSLRSVAGYVSDKTGRYWLITFIGYSVNLLAVPAMALASSWPVAAGLVLAERVGRAIRKPTVESMLSYTTGSLGRGWVYAVNTALDETGLAGACFAAGLMSFELISYHLSSTGVVTQHWIPLFLALSTGMGVIASLILGKLFDRIGLPVVLVAVFLSALFSPFVFLGGFFVALLGMMLWGIGYATQDTLLKAIIAGVLPEGRRNLAFGLFYLGYGGGWLVGSVTAGLLYERSLSYLIAFSVAVQLASIPVFFIAQKTNR
jgi:MFS transporter